MSESAVICWRGACYTDHSISSTLLKMKIQDIQETVYTYGKNTQPVVLDILMKLGHNLNQ